MQAKSNVMDCGHWVEGEPGRGYAAWERQGRTMCEACFAAWVRTPAGKAYERWFVDRVT